MLKKELNLELHFAQIVLYLILKTKCVIMLYVTLVKKNFVFHAVLRENRI